MNTTTTGLTMNQVYRVRLTGQKIIGARFLNLCGDCATSPQFTDYDREPERVVTGPCYRCNQQPKKEGN